MFQKFFSSSFLAVYLFQGLNFLLSYSSYYFLHLRISRSSFSFSSRQTLFQKSSRPLILSLFPSPFLTCYAILLTSFEGKDSIWGDDWSHSPFIWRSPSWGFLGVFSAVRQMPGDLCTAPRIISLSPLSLATDVTDATLGACGLWLGTRTGAGGTVTLTESFF